MKKNNPEMKQMLTQMEKVEFIKALANGYFSENDHGVIEYTPYLFDLNFKLLFYLYCVTGLEFDTKENADGELEVAENVLAAVESDPEVEAFYSDYRTGKYKNLPITGQLKAIISCAKDMVEYKKAAIMNHRNDELGNWVSSLSAIADMLRRIDLSKIDGKILSQVLLTALLKSGMNPAQLEAFAQAINSKTE